MSGSTASIDRPTDLLGYRNRTFSQTSVRTVEFQLRPNAGMKRLVKASFLEQPALLLADLNPFLFDFAVARLMKQYATDFPRRRRYFAFVNVIKRPPSIITTCRTPLRAVTKRNRSESTGCLNSIALSGINSALPLPRAETSNPV
jgi:hypothetical protein